MKERHWRLSVSCLVLAAAVGAAVLTGAPQNVTRQEYLARSRQFSERIEANGLAEAFTGVTTNGDVIEDLFEIRSTGVSTAAVVGAAEQFLSALSSDQRRKTVFPEDDVEWRKWANQHIYFREGMSFEEMSEAQRRAAPALPCLQRH